MELTRLYTMGSRWYATVRDGNLTNTAPTEFPATMRRVNVLKAIRSRTPDIAIAVEE